MKRAITLTAATLGLALLTGTAFADGHINHAIKARQAQMNLYAFNLGALGAMAKGQVEYDSEAATKAATNLVTLMSLDQSNYWPQGSDSGSAESRAKADMWANFPDVMAKGKATYEAAVAMQTAAGTDLDALRGAMGALGGACTACHKAYREPMN